MKYLLEHLFEDFRCREGISSLFRDCVNGFVNVFNAHNHFNASDNFIRFLNFIHSFIEINVDDSYDGNHSFSGLMSKSKYIENIFFELFLPEALFY